MVVEEKGATEVGVTVEAEETVEEGGEMAEGAKGREEREKAAKGVEAGAMVEAEEGGREVEEAEEGEREEREVDEGEREEREASYSPLLLSNRSRTSFRRRRLLALRSARASRA